MRKATRRQWITFSIVLALYLLFLLWIRSWWGLLFVPILFDIYISKLIPWTFWKNSKSKTVKDVMSWVDAIVFSLIAVYFVNIYLFQNYQIPSSSLEKSLLVGDFLYVSKVSYGPRVPNTPLSMPLAQHTLPIVNTKSYIEWPQWPYKRVKGFGKVKLNDIVVFNFPAGDTVALNEQQTDFYSLAYREGRRTFRNVNMDSLNREQQRIIYDAYYNAGSQAIRTNPRMYGEVVFRPVDRRENYVKRCVGLPGDTMEIIDGQVYINGSAIENAEGLQFNYFVQTTGPYIPEEMFREMGISKEDQMLIDAGGGWSTYFMQLGINGRNAQGAFNPVYNLPLTQKMLETFTANKGLINKIVREPADLTGGVLYPPNLHSNWDRNNYGPLWIPAKGETLTLTEDNLPIYERCIRNYEGNELEVKSDGIYINGIKTDSYTFQMDYYWMMGDNRDKSADSRFWGFVPEDHVVGKPLVVWLSLDKDRGWFDGKIRWNRLFKKVR